MRRANEGTKRHVTAVICTAHSSLHQAKHKQMSNANSSQAKSQACLTTGTNYTLYVIMQRYTKEERFETEWRVQLNQMSKFTV